MKDGCTVAKCKDCGGMFDTFSMQGEWCEDCFEKGLHRDMNDHWENYWREEMIKEKDHGERERDCMVIYDAKDDRIYLGTEINGWGQWILEYEDAEVKITAKTKRGLVLPTEQLIILGEL